MSSRQLAIPTVDVRVIKAVHTGAEVSGQIHLKSASLQAFSLLKDELFSVGICEPLSQFGRGGGICFSIHLTDFPLSTVAMSSFQVVVSNTLLIVMCRI